MLFRTAVCVGISVVGLGLGILGCEAEPEVFDPRLLQQDERSHATDVRPEALRPIPTTRQDAFSDVGPNGETRVDGEPVRPATGRDLDADPIVRMSLQEIIHRAVVNNHDVKVAAYQPAIEGARVTEASANFDPVFFTNLQYAQKNDLTGGQIFNSFTGSVPFTSFLNASDQGTLQTGIQENLGSGGQIQLQYQSTYNWFSPQTTQFNPFYESDLTLSLTQPLLRNFGYEVNHAQIIINRLNQRVSQLEFRKAVEQNVADIEKAYWQLAQAERDIRIQEQLVAQTEQTYKQLYNRMQEKIDVSQLQVSQTQTQLELRRTELIQFKSQARDLSYQIKGLMSDPEYPVSSNVLILPADEPVEDMIQFDPTEEINTAMENRLELGEQQLKVDSAVVTVGVAKNNLLPEFDFIGSAGPQGVAGNVGDAITSNANLQHADFTVGFKLQIPIGNRAARAIYRRSMLQHMQAIEQYRSFIEQIAVDVRTSADAVITAWNVIRSSRLSRFEAQDALTRINSREKSGEPLTPEFVQLKLQIQDSLAQAQLGEAQAIANYNIALSQLEKSKGTILRYDNVVLQEDLLKVNNEILVH